MYARDADSVMKLMIKKRRHVRSLWHGVRRILSPCYNTILRNSQKNFYISTFITVDYCAIKSRVLNSTKMRDFFVYSVRM